MTLQKLNSKISILTPERLKFIVGGSGAGTATLKTETQTFKEWDPQNRTFVDVQRTRYLLRDFGSDYMNGDLLCYQWEGSSYYTEWR